jgi:hypothetical protein
MDFTFQQLYTFLEFALHFSGSAYGNLSDFMFFCTTVLRISYLRQWISFPISNGKWFSLKINTTTWLEVTGMRHVTSLRPILHERIFLPLQYKQLVDHCNTAGVFLYVEHSTEMHPG